MKKLPKTTKWAHRHRTNKKGTNIHHKDSRWAVSFSKIQFVFIVAIGAVLYMQFFYIHQYDDKFWFMTDGSSSLYISLNGTSATTTNEGLGTIAQQQQQQIMMLTRESFQGHNRNKRPSQLTESIKADKRIKNAEAMTLDKINASLKQRASDKRRTSLEQKRARLEELNNNNNKNNNPDLVLDDDYDSHIKLQQEKIMEQNNKLAYIKNIVPFQKKDDVVPQVRKDPETLLQPDETTHQNSEKRQGVDYNVQAKYQQLVLGKGGNGGIATDDADVVSKPKQRSSPKVLLAIASTNMNSRNYKWDFRRRHIARNTWINFDPKWYGVSAAADAVNIPTKTCSLQEYQNYISPTDRDACQFVYTFVVSAHLKANWTDVENEGRQIKGRDEQVIVPPSNFNGTYENDLLYIDVHQNDRIGMGWAFTNYLMNLFDQEEEGFGDDFDYVAYTDSDIVVYPTKFWGHTIFGEQPRERLYAGFEVPATPRLCRDNDQCLKFKDPGEKSVMHRFVLLSKDLLRFVAESDPYQINPGLTPSNTFDIGVANVLFNKWSGILHSVLLFGINPRPIKTGLKNPPGGLGDPLERFDKYKDEFVSYDEPEEVALVESSWVQVGIGENPRLLLGIFSMDSKEEYDKRKMIRKTYLSSLGNHICSVHELLAGRLDNPDECQLAYTFVVGGNPNGPKELVEYNSSFPLTIENTMSPSEPDMLVLNIKENMKEGKSQTFFKYATTVVDTSVYFDYIAKADSDTVVVPNLLLTDEINKLPRYPNNMRTFAGDYRVKIPEKPEPHLGPNYFGGFFYFMSPDLARYVSSPLCNRSALAVWSEDQSMGSFVHSHPRPIRRIHIQTSWYRHPVKEVRTFGQYWNYLVRRTEKTGKGQRVAVPEGGTEEKDLKMNGDEEAEN